MRRCAGRRLVWLGVVLQFGAAASRAPALASAASTPPSGAAREARLTQEDAKVEAFQYEAALGEYLFRLGREYGVAEVETRVSALPEEMRDVVMNLVELKAAYSAPAFAVEPPVLNGSTLAIRYSPDGTCRATLRTATSLWFVWLSAVPRSDPGPPVQAVSGEDR